MFISTVEVLTDERPLRVADVQRVLRQAKQRVQMLHSSPVDNVDNPNNAGSVLKDTREMLVPLSSAEQQVIDHLVARVDSYLADPSTLTPQTWERLRPLAQRLHDLLKRTQQS